MEPRIRQACLLAITVLLAVPVSAQTFKVIMADATYVMGDSDTLAGAEENALLRAKRKAVEEAGVYIETSSQDIETSSGGTTAHLNSLGVRTIAAAVTQTEILQKRRSFDGERLAFYVKIRATVHLDMLAEAIKRMKSEEQLAEHHRQLEAENHQLKTQLDQLRRQLQDSRTPQTQPALGLKNRRAADELVRSAVQTRNLPEKIELASRAIMADELYVDAYIVRGQTYLRIASLAFSKKSHRAELAEYVERAITDFDHALTLDPTSTWALLGRGDAFTWQGKMQESAKDYERVLQFDPLFDIARQRLIALNTTIARKQATSRQWRQALATLDKVLQPSTPPSWVAQEKESYLLRSQIYTELGELERAVEDLTTVIRVDPGNTQAFLLRAKLYRRLMQGRLAKEDFEQACAQGLEEACAGLQ
jgi:tetratricopeptide (TPR) repeat protein